MDVGPTGEAAPDLTGPARRRYARQIMLDGFGEEGQRRLAGARALVVGAGGLGSVTATYLAAAGVGTIGIVDDDVVEESNLHRQVIHSTGDLGRPKVDSAADRLAALNPLVEVVRHHERLGPDSAMRLVGAYDVVVDGADNFATRYVVADACALAGVPHVWGSILRFDGQASVWWPPHGPCYRCVFPAPPAPGSVLSCAEAGVLGSLCATIGAACSTEALKVIAGIGRPLIGRLLVHDALAGSYAEIPLRRNPACALCGPDASIAAPGAGLTATPEPADRLDPAGLARELSGPRPVVLVDVREPHEWAGGMIPGARGIPLGQLTAAGDLPAWERVVLYCAGGVRSAAGVAALTAAGFADVTDLAGGIAAWQAAGGEIR